MLQRLIHRWRRLTQDRTSTLIVGCLWLLICLLVLVGVAHLSEDVLEQEAFALDERILLWIHQFANPILDRLMVIITHLGNPGVLVPLACVGIGWFCVRQKWTIAFFFAATCVGSAILTAALKLAFGKQRPRLWPQLITETTYSYPSGHALGSMVLYGLIAYLVAYHYPRYARLVYGIAAFLIGAIGFSRLYLGVHWPTDVLAGYGIGWLWLVVCIALLQRRLAATR